MPIPCQVVTVSFIPGAIQLTSMAATVRVLRSVGDGTILPVNTNQKACPLRTKVQYRAWFTYRINV